MCVKAKARVLLVAMVAAVVAEARHRLAAATAVVAVGEAMPAAMAQAIAVAKVAT